MRDHRVPGERRSRPSFAEEQGSPLFGALAVLLRHPAEIAGATVMGVMVCAIVYNALAGQQGAHPAPIFSGTQQQQQAQAKPAAGRKLASPQTVPSSRSPAVAAAEQDDVAVSQGELLQDIQAELAKRGLYDGKVDGLMGPRTATAIRDWQQRNRRQVTGAPSEALLAALQDGRTDTTAATPRAPQRPAAPRRDAIADFITRGGASPAPTPAAAPPIRRGGAVMRVEQGLAALGYGPLSVDGVYDDDTRLAIARFESDRSLPVTGKVSDRLVAELDRIGNEPQ